MSQSTHQIAVKAADQTGAAFKSIKGRAVSTGAQIRSALGGAIAAAGAYMGFSAIKGGIDTLGHLSDVAMKTSTSVDELTKTANAMGALGIQNMSVEQLAKSFDYMQKTTGRTGMAGFYETIKEIGKIPDTALRGQEAMKIFGRSGMEFIPLINAADETTAALETVINAMPGIPQSAADAGDAASDAMGFAANQVKSIWLQGLGFLSNFLNNDYTGDVRTAALAAGNYLEYYTKLAVAKCITWYKKLQNGLQVFGETIGTFVGTIAGGGSIGQAFDAAGDAWGQALDEYAEKAKELDKIEEERTARFQKNYEDRAVAVEHFADAYNKAAISTTQRKQREEKKAAELDMSSAAKAPRISNEMMLAGSNQALRTSLLGPELQSETKKQTKILEKIAENTKKETTDEVEVF